MIYIQYFIEFIFFLLNYLTINLFQRFYNYLKYLIHNFIIKFIFIFLIIYIS
jgi:hypothetical protein